MSKSNQGWVRTGCSTSIYGARATAPRISVIMPVRNGEAYLTAAVDSILGQSNQDIEFIIIDDGSTDATRSLLGAASRQHAGIRVLSNPETGIVDALEAGRAVARAPYIARMDADDIALPLRLELQADYLDNHPSVVAVGGQVRYIDAHGAQCSQGRYPFRPSDCRAYLAFGAPFCHPAVMMRRDALEAVGGYRHGFEPAEDFDLWLRLSTVGDFANLDRTVLYYRRHAAAVTARRAQANARAVCLARLTHVFGATVQPSSWPTLHAADAEWPAIEAALPTHVRLEARASYLLALTLNGGITEPKAWAHLMSALPELAHWAHTKDRSDQFAFIVIRAAYHMARAQRPSHALLPLLLGLRYAARSTFEEVASSLWARLDNRHRTRASMSSERVPSGMPSARPELSR